MLATRKNNYLRNIKKRLNEEMSANDLAQSMQITTRSARRILSELEVNGLAQVMAAEIRVKKVVQGKFINIFYKETIVNTY